MRLIILFSLLLLTCLGALQAQTQVHGLWKGHITIGGLQSNQGYPMELQLQKRGRKITGRSFIYLSTNRVIEMELSGQIYDDSSLYLEEVRSNSDSSERPAFMRKYQLVFKRGIYDSSLNGYWQEINQDPMDPKRERGRITLERAPPGKA